jgi:hypothetical protein
MTDEQRQRLKQQLRERIAQMPEGLARNRLFHILLLLDLGDTPRNIHKLLNRSLDASLQ